MYTIKRAAELTGISLSTLRAWERRYGVVSPARSDGRYRLYSPADLRALAIMASLVNDGWSAKEAAAETLSRTSDVVQPPSVGGSEEPGEVTPTSELLEAARELDTAKVADVLDEAFARGGFERVVDEWLLPALGGLGDAWADGRVSVAGEHLVSYAIQRRLAAIYEAAGGRMHGPAVVLGLPGGARHELGILAFAAAARRAGFTTAYVGADLPTEDWEVTVAARQASAAVLAVPRPADVVPAREICETLLRAHPALLVFVGGARQDEVGAGSLPLGHGIRTGVAQLAASLEDQRSPRGR
jgi:DNA-binding transcriptional MerR regulator/methylmalonyl-CoA mutase cobalamin-binding subunit